MRIEEEIVEWAATRPSWQRAILRRVGRGETFDDAKCQEVANRLAGDGWPSSEAFSIDDLPAIRATAKPVSLLSLGNLSNCNALVPGQTLDFAASGLTVVYGDNGSGKSGYARLIKRVVRAWHRQPVLADVFSSEGSGAQGAEVAIDIGGVRVDFAWPNGACAEVAQVGFYDDACGDNFITKEHEVTYRPPALFVIDELIRICDIVRVELDKRLRENIESASALPQCAEGTASATFLTQLSCRTSQVEIEKACAVAPDFDAQIDAAKIAEHRLRQSDPSKEQTRLRADADRLLRVSARISANEAALGTTTEVELEAARREVQVKSEAVALASNVSFDAEPLPGVGAAAWQALWTAAREYSLKEVYPDKTFPVTEAGASCVLCQQLLTPEAGGRLARFDAFVRNTAQREHDRALATLRALRKRFAALSVATIADRLDIEQLGAEHNFIADDCRKCLDAYEQRRLQFVALLEPDAAWNAPAALDAFDTAGVEAVAQGLRNEADQVTDSTFAARIAAASLLCATLESAKRLVEHRDTVEKEVARRRAHEHLESVKKQTSTTAVSKKAADLARQYGTTVARDRFTRECEKLRLERVTLEDRGGTKGTLQHKPAFVGAFREATLPQVLSEGEQTALGLAGFFTDTFLDPSRSAIVLDDPVTSLDHSRRGYVADRLVAFAGERQVIVFTHDLAFVVDLRAAAQREGVDVTERTIERLGSGKPGACRTEHPWKARDVAGRLDKLGRKLAEIRKGRAEWAQEKVEQECADWAGSLSETWERLVAQEVVGQVVARGSMEIRPRMFRVLSRITSDDDNEFQASYAKISRWARRHDKDVAMNYTAPDDNEMATELALVHTWFKRVKGYAGTAS